MHSSPARKTRPNAWGVKKVKTGCRTCKIRHKKCDETRPACLQCQITGRRCDFAISQPPPTPFGSPSHLALSGLGATLWDYFRLVCAQEFSLVFDCSSWEALVVRLALLEPFAYYAALSISSLSRAHYCQQAGSPPGATTIGDYATTQYNLAIEKLNSRLDETPGSAELAVLGSILFINIEFLLADVQPRRLQPHPIHVHLSGGLAILQILQQTAAPGLSESWDHLEDALYEVGNQLQGAELKAKFHGRPGCSRP